jgi:hypothetical protein
VISSIFWGLTLYSTLKVSGRFGRTCPFNLGARRISGTRNQSECKQGVATRSSETSVYFQRTTGNYSYIPEDRTVHNHGCENHKSYRIHLTGVEGGGNSIELICAPTPLLPPWHYHIERTYMCRVYMLHDGAHQSPTPVHRIRTHFSTLDVGMQRELNHLCETWRFISRLKKKTCMTRREPKMTI